MNLFTSSFRSNLVYHRHKSLNVKRMKELQFYITFKCNDLCDFFLTAIRRTILYKLEMYFLNIFSCNVRIPIRQTFIMLSNYKSSLRNYSANMSLNKYLKQYQLTRTCIWKKIKPTTFYVGLQRQFVLIYVALQLRSEGNSIKILTPSNQHWSTNDARSTIF